jgi:probable F420-dependent oxidoreductase
MEIGVVLTRALSSRADLTRVARAAEGLGLHSLWTTEHIAIPSEIKSRYPYSDDGRPTFRIDSAWHEAMVGLAFLAGVTERIRLGTSVIPLFNRDPLSLAKQAASVDVLSEGRLELGLGAGWLAEEAELLGHPHDHRGARLDECIEILRKAWTSTSFEHHGRFWDYRWAVGVHPQPPQGAQVPIWIGGESDRALRTTAERAHGNLLWQAEKAEVADFRRRLDALKPGLRLAVSMTVEKDRDPLEKASALAEAGADRVLLMDYAEAETAIRNLRRFAKS